MTINWMKWESAHFSTIFIVWHRWQSQLNKISFTRKKTQSYLSLPGISEILGKCLFFPPSLEEASCHFIVLKKLFLLLVAEKLVLVPMLKTYVNHNNNHQLNSTFTPMASQFSFSCLLGFVLFCLLFFKDFLGKEPFDTGLLHVGKQGGEIKAKLHHSKGYWKDYENFKN